MGVYQPLYIFFFLILLGIIYLPVLLSIINRFKFNAIGILFIILSIACYLLIAKYMFDAGIYADEHSSLFEIGFLELILLSYSYIFVGLSVLLGKKGERQN